MKRYFCPYLGGEVELSEEREGHIVVVSETEPLGRHWVITAYQARKLSGGEVEWKRS